MNLFQRRYSYRLHARKQKQMQVRANRMFLEMRRRPRIFPPGPYLTAHGNMKFLGRDLTKS